MHPPWSLSSFTNIIRQHSQCGSKSIFCLLPLSLAACLSLSIPTPASLFSLSPRLSVRRWQLHSWGALRGAGKTKIWFSGSDLDFLQIGWKIRRSLYSYTTQSLSLQLQTMTADHRGCSYQHKCAICDKASLCFLPKTMTRRGTPCAERRPQRNRYEMREKGKKKSETKAQRNSHKAEVNAHITRGKKKWINFLLTSLFCGA